MARAPVVSFIFLAAGLDGPTLALGRARAGDATGVESSDEGSFRGLGNRPAHVTHIDVVVIRLLVVGADVETR